MVTNPAPAAAAAAAAAVAAAFAAFVAAIHGAVKRPVSPRATTVVSHLPSACAAFRYPSARIVTERSSSASCQTHFALAVSEESLSSGKPTPSRVASDRMLAVGIEPCASASRTSRLKSCTFSPAACTCGNSLSGLTNCITPSFASTRRTAMRSTSLVHDPSAVARALSPPCPSPVGAASRDGRFPLRQEIIRSFHQRTVKAAGHVSQRR